MGRAPCCDKVGLKKGPWTAEEDRKLVAFVEEHGHGSWRSLPKRAGLLRCGKSCRLRWTNYLRPDIKRGKFSPEEEQTIIQVHALLGNRWSAISSLLPKRTDNEIKNYWNTHLKKKLLKMGIDPVTHRPKSDAQSFINTSSAALSHMAQWESARLEAEARLAREAKFRSKALSSSNATNLRPDGATEALDVKQQWEKSLRLLGLGCGEVSSPCASFSNDQIGPKSPTSTLCNFDMHHTLQPHGKLSWIDKISEIEQLLQGERTYTSANIQSSEILTMLSSIRTSDAGLQQASEDIGTWNEDSPDASYPGFLSESSSQDADEWKMDSHVLAAAVSTSDIAIPESSSQDADTWKRDSHVLPAAVSTSDFTGRLFNEVDLISEDIVSNRSLCPTPECDEILSPLLVDLPHDSGFQLDIAEPQPDLSLLSDNRMEKQGADYWENMINQLTDSCLTV